MTDRPRRECACTDNGKPWTDPPVLVFEVGDDSISAVLADLPAIRWTYWCVLTENGPQVILRSITPTGAPVLLDSLPHPLPTRRLAYYWQRAMTPQAPGEPAFDPREVLRPRQLPRRPDKRIANRDPQEYARRFYSWSAPIAEEVRRADAHGCGRHAHIKAMFGVSPSQAEELIRLTRNAGHELPFIRPVKSPRPVEPIGTRNRRTK